MTANTGNFAWGSSFVASDGASRNPKSDGLYGSLDAPKALSKDIIESKDGKSRSRSQSVEKGRHHKSKRSRSRDRAKRSRSREKRHRSKERRTRRSRSKDKRPRSRDRVSLYKNRKRSRSRETKRSRDRSRSREKRRSNSKERKDQESRSPARRFPAIRASEERKSRSRSPFRAKIPSKAALKFIAQQSKESIAAKLAGVTKNALDCGENPNKLPLNLLGATTMTPQLVLQQTMAAMSVQAGVALPKYYNPAAVNPLKYAEQMQKRKLLWQPKEKTESQGKSTVWAQTHFTQDQDGKMSAKFRKLMGLKDKEAEKDNKPASTAGSSGTEVIQKQEALFRDLDQQYEMARITTHTQRGVGLGYSSQPQQLIYPK